MKWIDFLNRVGDEPVVTTGLLLAGETDRSGVERQLSRWTAAGRLIQLGRGVYTVAPPFRNRLPHPFLLANRLRRPSYVSLQSALSYWGLIPEGFASVTSVTTGRPQTVRTSIGEFSFRHVKVPWFHGYEDVSGNPDQPVLVATAEKALLDLAYLTPRSADPQYLDGLRLAGLDRLGPERLLGLAKSSGRPKLAKAAQYLVRLREQGGMT